MHFETIQTKNLILKGLSPEDMNSVFENHTKAEIKNLLGHRSEEDFLKEESKFKNGYSCYNRSFKLFLITDKSSNTIIGRCGIHNWNIEHKRAEIGYVMEDENYKRKGLMTEVLAAVLEYGFTKLKLNRIEALVGKENTASLKLLEKYNFVKEGELREHYFIAGKHEDSVIFSLLHNEYSNEK